MKQNCEGGAISPQEKDYSKFEVRTERIKGKVSAYRYHIRLDDNIAEPTHYRKHFDIMRKASEKDELVFYISSYGGFLDTTVQYVYTMLDTKAKTKSVVYVAASAATLIAFAADEVEMRPIGTVMLHNFSVQQQGKGNELRAKTEFDDIQFSAMCKMLYKGILTDKEVEQLKEDKDFWRLGRDITKRMKKHSWVPLRKRGEYGKS